jgi:hypothetical protein
MVACTTPKGASGLNQKGPLGCLDHSGAPIDSMFEYIETGCIAIAAFILAAGEALRRERVVWKIIPFRRFFGSRNWRFVPAVMVTLAAAIWLGDKLLDGKKAYQEKPTVENPTSQKYEPRSKQALNELLSESGQLLDIIEKTGIPLAEEWRRLLGRNPEEACLDLDIESYRSLVTSEREKFRVGHEKLLAVMNQNKIDQSKLAPLIGGESVYQNTGFYIGIASLDTFTRDFDYMRNLNVATSVVARPSCEILIRSNRAPNMFIVMDRGLNQFNSWLTSSDEKIKNYRDDLRLELRSVAP